MSAAGIARALWPALRRILIRLGRWVLDDLLEDGVRLVVYYIRKRANKVFAARLGRSRTKVRRRWLARRIARWNLAAEWLEANADRLSNRALRAFDGMAKRIPRTSRHESARSAA